MPLLKFTEFKPDISDYEGSSTKNILNVVPQGDGYGPFSSFAGFTKTLPGPCRGGFYALNSDGTVSIFAGTATDLYQLNNTNFIWTKVSAGGVSYSGLSATAQWQFAQTGNLVWATQANAVLQVFTVGTSSAFSAALGSPPQAAYISVIGQFLVLSGLLSQPFRIQWSGLANFNSSTAWTAGLSSSDFQDFPDGGVVRGVAGGDQSGIVFQDQVIRTMAYIAGSPVIFQIDRVTQGLGLQVASSLVQSAGNILFYSGKGFYIIPPGGQPTQIGRERIDRMFAKDYDIANPQLFMAAADPRSSRVYWAYKSVAGAAGLFDKALGYDPLLDRWFPVQMSGQFLLGLSQSGVTLEDLDPIAPTPLTITGAAASPTSNGSGGHLIRLTLANEANANFSILTQPSIVVYNVIGTTEANSVITNPASMDWKFTVISPTTIDLVGSTFTNAYVSGGQIGGSVDAMTLSFDDYPTAVQPQLAQFNSTGTLGFFSGPALEASLQTAEQGTDEQRLDVRGFRPITDAQGVLGSIWYRDTQQATSIQSAAVGLSRIGRCDLMRDARYVRFQCDIPAGEVWTFIGGVVPDTGAGSSI
jgi:hypothetical protein